MPVVHICPSASSSAISIFLVRTHHQGETDKHANSRQTETTRNTHTHRKKVRDTGSAAQRQRAPPPPPPPPASLVRAEANWIIIILLMNGVSQLVITRIQTRDDSMQGDAGMIDRQQRRIRRLQCSLHLLVGGIIRYWQWRFINFVYHDIIWLFPYSPPKLCRPLVVTALRI